MKRGTPSTIDEAMTAIAIAPNRDAEVIACEALVAVAQSRLRQLRAALTEDQATALIEEYGLAVSNKDRMQVMSLGKAMTHQTYQTFATLRDDTIPVLGNRLLAAVLAGRATAPQAGGADARPVKVYPPLPDFQLVGGVWAAIGRWRDADVGNAAHVAALHLESVLATALHSFADATVGLRTSGAPSEKGGAA